MMGYGLATNGPTLVAATGMLVILTAQGQIGNATTGDSATAQLSYGTGTAPSNAGAAAGTQVGPIASWQALTGTLYAPFNVMAIFVIPPGTYWFDLAVAYATGGTGVVTGVTFQYIAIPI